MEFSAQKSKLNRLGFWYGVFPILLSIPIAISIYIFQDFIPSHLNSYELCKSHDFRRISFWALPKISSHCELILNGNLKNHPSSGIAIFLDVVVATYFVLYAIVLVVYCCIAIKNYRAIVEEYLKSYSSNKLGLGYLAGVTGVLYSIYFTFFSSDLVSNETFGLSRAFAMFSSQYGTGAALHMLAASVGPLLSVCMIIILFAYNSLHAGTQSNKK